MGTMPDRELSFVKRHFGTDVLAAGWLLLLATFFYTAYSILFLMEMWGDTFPRVFFAWDNLIASLVFVVAGVYFALLVYPDQLEEFERSSLGVDLDQLSWREKYFTANKFLIAIWMFIVACGFYYAAGIVWIIYGQPLVGVTFLLSTFAGQAACFIWAYAAMPANMQSNDGAGSSVLYDTCCGCDWPWLKARMARTRYWATGSSSSRASARAATASSTYYFNPHPRWRGRCSPSRRTWLWDRIYICGRSTPRRPAARSSSATIYRAWTSRR